MSDLRVLISGSHGMIGEALVTALEARGDTVTRLVRGNPKNGEIPWDPKTGGFGEQGIEGFDAVVHLGGVSIGEKRWSENERGRIWDSRINSTEFLAQAIAQTISRPEVFVVASAIGFYGDQGDSVLDESSPKGDGFLAEVTDNWERSGEAAVAAGVRTVHVRTGIVLDSSGGLIKRLGPVFKGALGGRLGDGGQYMSWISLRDEVRAIIFAIDNSKISGPIVTCSPNPATNLEFTKAFAKAVHRPAVIPVWPWMLHLAFGRQLTEEVLLVSQRGNPRALLKAGFKFKDEDLSDALVKAVAPKTKEVNA